VIKAQRSAFEQLVAEKKLEIEWSDTVRQSLEIVPTRDVVPWLLKLPGEPRWIMVGRLLRRGEDAAVLEDKDALGAVIEQVFTAFRPLWEQTELMAHC
jgi:hypothetical protein